MPSRPRLCAQTAMSSIVQCLLRNCFEYDDDHDGDGQQHDRGSRTASSALPPRLRAMVRSASGGVPTREQRGGGYFAPTALVDPHEDEDEETGESSSSRRGDDVTGEEASNSAGGSSGRRASPSEEGDVAEPPPPHPSLSGEHGGGVRGLFRRLGFAPHAGQYGRLEGALPVPSRDDMEETEMSQHLGVSAAASEAAVGSPDSPVHHRRSIGNPPRDRPRARDNSKSPLRTASSFDAETSSNRDIIPAISLDEVVLPGSSRQKQMSLAMAATIDDEIGDECVICLDGFDPTNPRMPTLCGCGENRTYFHLPCLYQWVEQDRNCPSCRKKLRWEEF